MQRSRKPSSPALSPLALRVRPARRLIQLYVGLVAYGMSMALMVEAHLGTMPWDVFHQGVARLTGLSFGTVTIVVGVIVLLLWIPLRQRPGIGTVSNVIVIGLGADASLALLPTPDSPAVRWGFLVGALGLNAVASGLYIGARLGPGPRDGLMTGLAARGHSLRVVRTGIEVSVVATGWLLGGTLGIGTVLYAITIGPLVHVLLPRFTVPRWPAPQASPSVASAPRSEEGTDVVDQEVGLLQRGEVPAPGHVGPALDAVAPLGEGAWHDEVGLAGEHGDAGRSLDPYARR
jgi:uncharacterized membrane protein YczE